MIYFRNVVQMLQSQEWLNESESIEIAKGKNEIPSTYKGVFKQLNRRMKWLRK